MAETISPAVRYPSPYRAAAHLRKPSAACSRSSRRLWHRPTLRPRTVPWLLRQRPCSRRRARNRPTAVSPRRGELRQLAKQVPIHVKNHLKMDFPLNNPKEPIMTLPLPARNHLFLFIPPCSHIQPNRTLPQPAHQANPALLPAFPPVSIRPEWFHSTAEACTVNFPAFTVDDLPKIMHYSAFDFIIPA